MWPGNTADVTTLLPVIDRLRQRFGIDRVCIVADRGMISAAAIAGLEERQLEYILGARERGDVWVKKIVMENDDPFVPLLIERQTGSASGAMLARYSTSSRHPHFYIKPSGKWTPRAGWWRQSPITHWPTQSFQGSWRSQPARTFQTMCEKL